MINNLNIDTITFGKYKNKKLSDLLKDRKYCEWILKEEWFKNNYEYLYNRILEYNPRSFFLKNIEINNDNFLENYQYFNLKNITELSNYLELIDNEIICYNYYLHLIEQLKEKIYLRIKENKENIFDIKAPIKWLQTFEKETNLTREEFKNFLYTYDLPNLTYIIEDIKKQGGIEYKGAKSFLIAKENSEKQENFWENILKNKYGENISCQFKYEKCIFDFLNISKNTLYECKINLKDYNETQHKKYLLTLNKYKIIYLISNNCIIDIQKKEIYTTNEIEYLLYICNIPLLKSPSKLDLIISEFKIININNIENGV